MDVILYPGRDVPRKRYQAYFRKYINLCEVSEHPIAILCHSRGIEGALQDEHKDIPIIALDPSFFPDNNRVFIWARKGRIVDEHNLNIIWYEEQTHYPHEVKHIRDQIVEFIIHL